MAALMKAISYKPFLRGAGPHHSLRNCLISAPRCRATRLSVNMTLVAESAVPKYDIYVKGSPQEGELGDCPFSHRTMLTMEEKGVPYNKMLIDEQKMPEWVKEICDGKQQIPFMTELETGKWMYDSDKITPYLDKKFPEPSMKPRAGDLLGQNLFPTVFMEYMTSKGNETPAKEEALVSELNKLDDHLFQSGQQYFGGDNVDANDLQLAPKIKHIMVGGKSVKGFEFPQNLKALNQWFERMTQRKSWKNTYYTEKYVSDGWHVKMEMMGAK